MKKLLTLLMMVVLTQITFSQFNPWTIVGNSLVPKSPQWKIPDSLLTSGGTGDTTKVASATNSGFLLYSDFNNFSINSSALWSEYYIDSLTIGLIPQSANSRNLGSISHPFAAVFAQSLMYQDSFENWIAPTDTIAGPFAGDVEEGSGILRGVDYEYFYNALQPNDTTNYPASEGVTGFLTYADWYYFTHKPDTADASFYASLSTTGFISYADYNLIMEVKARIDSITHNNTASSLENGNFVKVTVDSAHIGDMTLDSLAYGTLYLDDDHPDTLVVSALNTSYTVGAGIYPMQHGDYFQGLIAKDSMIEVARNGHYEVSYSLRLEGVSGLTGGDYFKSYIYINDVQQSKTGSKCNLVGNTDVGALVCIPTIFELNWGDTVKIKIISITDASNTITIQFCQLHLKRFAHL